jgi:hypothetical protein
MYLTMGTAELKGKKRCASKAGKQYCSELLAKTVLELILKGPNLQLRP